MHFKKNLNDSLVYYHWYIIQQPCDAGSKFVITLFIYGEIAMQRN